MIYASVNAPIKESFIEQWRSKLTLMQMLFTHTEFNEQLLRTMMGLKLDSGPEEPATPSPPVDTTPQAPRDPLGDALREHEAKRAEQGHGIENQLSPAKNRAYGAGNRLLAWVQSDRKPQAIDAHNRGMELLRSADANAAKLPKNATTADFESWGFAAVTDYDRATAIFREGLALYPPGSPPKSA
jgi:hypothetical protein